MVRCFWEQYNASCTDSKYTPLIWSWPLGYMYIKLQDGLIKSSLVTNAATYNSLNSTSSVKRFCFIPCVFKCTHLRVIGCLAFSLRSLMKSTHMAFYSTSWYKDDV